MKKQLFIFCVITCFYACEKEEVLPSVVNELTFECLDETADSYFKGEMNDIHFCYYEGFADYELDISKMAAYETEEATTSSAINPDAVSNFRIWANLGFKPEVTFTNSAAAYYPHLQHYVRVETPRWTSDTLLKTMIKHALDTLGNQPLQSDEIGSTEGFNIVFEFSDREDGIRRTFQTAGGSQQGSSLKITELEIEEFPLNQKQYTVTFEFSCDLYYRGDPDRFYRRLENAELRLVFFT